MKKIRKNCTLSNTGFKKIFSKSQRKKLLDNKLKCIMNIINAQNVLYLINFTKIHLPELRVFKSYFHSLRKSDMNIGDI